MPMQGPKGAAAEGRMIHVGAIFNSRPRDWKGEKRPETQAPYATTLTTLALLRTPLRTQAAQAGLDRAERWIAVSDGASGLEGILRMNFARIEAVILDSRHAEEHLSDFAKSLAAGDEAGAKEIDGELEEEDARKGRRQTARTVARLAGTTGRSGARQAA